MKITYLKDHLILKKASGIFQEYMKKCPSIYFENNPEPTEKERYGIDVLLTISDIIACIDQLYFSIEMLSGYRKNNFPKKMNRADYVIYGIENYYLRLTSVFDRCLILVNRIFQLGFSEDKCKYNQIKKRMEKEKIDTNIFIKINEFTSKFRNTRNSVAHRKLYSEEELNELASFYYLMDDGDENIKKYENHFKVRMDRFVLDKKKEFKINVIELEKLVNRFFDSLIEPFDKISGQIGARENWVKPVHNA